MGRTAGGEKEEIGKEKMKRIGYYSGHTLANRMGLSTQIPFTKEITSNLAPAPV